MFLTGKSILPVKTREARAVIVMKSRAYLGGVVRDKSHALFNLNCAAMTGFNGVFQKFFEGRKDCR